MGAEFMREQLAATRSRLGVSKIACLLVDSPEQSLRVLLERRDAAVLAVAGTKLSKVDATASLVPAEPIDKVAAETKKRSRFLPDVAGVNSGASVSASPFAKASLAARSGQPTATAADHELVLATAALNQGRRAMLQTLGDTLEAMQVVRPRHLPPVLRAKP
jgi:hypothetical protein